MNNLSLVEKYRPKNLDNIIEQSNIVNALKNTLKSKNIPHLLFYGPSGVGKTSIAITLVKTLFSKNNYNDRILELNASDERGINIVREKIKNFAKMTINNDNDARFKVIILDEADSMTIETQLALRYIIEQYSTFTRFIIICNYINKIIEPIISRCALYRFKPLKKNTIINYLNEICIKEDIKINNEKLNKLYDKTDGDLRLSINYLEKYKLCINSNENDKNIFNLINNLYLNLLKKNKSNIINDINNILNHSISGEEIIDILIKIIIDCGKLSESQKCDIFLKISYIDNKLKNGGEDFIQILYLTQIILTI